MDMGKSSTWLNSDGVGGMGCLYGMGFVSVTMALGCVLSVCVCGFGMVGWLVGWLVCVCVCVTFISFGKKTFFVLCVFAVL